MAFEWSWKGMLKKAGEQGMEGYTPNGPAQNASALMQNYNPNPAPMRLPQSVNNPRQGAEYNFDATEINQYMRQEDEKKQRIASLEAQIANLEKSIAEKTAQLQNWSGVDNEIAAIEASKINVADPTMVWRWNRGIEDAATQAQLNREASERANGALNYDAIAKFKNTSDMLVNMRESLTKEGIEQQINNIAAAIRDGRNIGAPTADLEKKMADLNRIIHPENEEEIGDTGEFKSGTPTENLDALVTDFLNGKHSSNEIQNFINSNKINDQQRIKLNSALRIAKKREKNEADEADFKKFLKDRGINPDTVSQKIKESERRTWKALRGK